MDKTFSFYVTKSRSLVGLAMKGKGFGGALMLAVYTLASFIGKLFLLTAPIFAIADSNLSKMIVETHNLSFEKAFDGVGAKYKNALITEAVARLMAFGLLIVLSIPVLILLVPLLREGPIGIGSFELFYIILNACIAYSCLCAFVSLLFKHRYSGYGYVCSNSANLDVGDIVHCVKQGSKKSYWPTLLLVFIRLFMYAATAALIVVAVYWLFTINPGFVLNYLVAIAVSILYGVLYVFLFSRASLDLKATGYLIYQETIKAEKSIVVKQVASSEIEYEPLFVEEDAIKFVDPTKVESEKGGK